MSSNYRVIVTARAPFTRSALPSSEDWGIGLVSPGRLTTRGMSHAIRMTPPPRAHCTKRAGQSFWIYMTVGALLAHWLLWEALERIGAVVPGQTLFSPH